MREMFTDSNYMRSDDFLLPADDPRPKGKYKDDAEAEAERRKRLLKESAKHEQ